MQLASMVALAANAIWALAILYLHVAESGLNPSRRYLSEYVLTDSGRVMYLAFAGLAVAGLALATGLVLTGVRAWPLAAVVGAYGCAVAAAGWFPTDSSVDGVMTRSGELHNLAAYIVYRTLALAGALAAAYALLGWPPGVGRDWTWFVLSSAVVLGFALTNYGWRFAEAGTLQRLFFLAILVWLVVTSIRVGRWAE